MGKIKDSKWTYVVLSLLLSVILWFYVTTTLNPEKDDYVRGVQVVFNGEDLLAQRGLMTVSYTHLTLPTILRV